jgi:hypothetical protein
VGGGRHAFYQLDDVFLQRSGFAGLYDNLYNDCRGAEVFFLDHQLSYQPPVQEVHSVVESSLTFDRSDWRETSQIDKTNERPYL